MTRFDLLFTKYIGRDITVLLSGARVVRGKLIGIDKDYGLAFETRDTLIFLNSEGVSIEGFEVSKKIRKRKGKKEKRLKQ